MKVLLTYLLLSIRTVPESVVLVISQTLSARSAIVYDERLYDVPPYVYGRYVVT